MNKKPKISAVIPAYNEEKTIAGVLKALINSPLIDEVICINDGSTDNTQAEIERLDEKATIINLEQNRGKGYALAKGIQKANGEKILLLDADLTNLDERHIKKILQPALNKKAEVVLGLPKAGTLLKTFAKTTGQRVYNRKDLLPLLKEMESSKYGIEVLLNHRLKNKKTVWVNLKDLYWLTKTQKRTSKLAFKYNVQMVTEMLQEYGRIKELPPKDITDLVDMLREVSNVEELESIIKKIKNRHIKTFFKKHLSKYLKEIKKIFDT